MAATIAYIHKVVPEVPVILDAKRGDIGSSNAGYVREAFDLLKADAITVSPYLGEEALRPFLDRAGKGVVVLCRTSNKGAGEFQDRLVWPSEEEGDKWGISVEVPIPFYQLVAYRVSREWNKDGNCALVVGATYPKELQIVRHIIGNMPILIPGIGTQGGDVEETVVAGQDSRGMGMIVNASRSIIYASEGPDFAEKAKQELLRLHNLVNMFRKKGVT